ncbi:MAG: hypothetical protein A2Y04_02510 [Omnitrophica WOR_2 bacterium GWC2_45_7]|nr:MAG: hypothetical protein A2Z81_06595 [Omnitrophica WOR_2 bacterium GWA2_45_18]OGX21272.1 MAG: hypothetical protein A2Y04_02510 [Omnitrophica WOR_2 bacterium GWC2_45_7]
MKRRILGIQAFFPDSSACLVEEGKILCAVQEERLTRHKRTRAFPNKAIEYCLKKTNTSLEEIDTVAFPVNPGIYLEHFNSPQSAQPRYRGEIWYSVLNHLMALAPEPLRVTDAAQHIGFAGNGKMHIQYVDHHLAHAAIGFYPSGFQEAAILSVDGFGEKDCVMFARGRGQRIEPFFRQEFPHSLGCFYLTMTEFLGFTPNSDEWKVMGASSYGRPEVYYETLLSLFKFKEMGFELDLNYFNFYNFHRPLNYSSKLLELIGPARRSGEEMTQRHFDIAAATQKVAETVLFRLAAQLYEKAGLDRLCFSGGVAMNSVLNGKIVTHSPFKDVYIPFSPDDSGGSIGAALYVAHHLKGMPRQEWTHNYLGPAYAQEEILGELKKFGLTYEVSPDPAKEAAEALCAGKIIGWFQGALEFGDRALGNRSILADPRKPEMKDAVNIKVKFREEFRPFAPSILEECLEEYFEEARPTPFMEKVFTVKENKREDIPAVVHVDGSGRLQTVSERTNPLYHSLIKHFQALTGIPVVLNTSFNVKGEPMVCSVQDAVRTFYTCGLQVLFLGKYVVKKGA